LERPIQGISSDRVKSFAKSRNASASTVLLSAFRAAQFCMTSEEDAIIGISGAARKRVELSDADGLRDGLLCIRTQIEEDSFDELVRKVHATVAAASSNADVPFEEIMSKLRPHGDPNDNSIVRIGFAYHAVPSTSLSVSQATDVSLAFHATTSKLDLVFHVYSWQDCLRARLIYSIDLFEVASMENLLPLFAKMLTTSIEAPHVPLNAIFLFTDEDHKAMSQMGLLEMQTTNYPRDSNLVDLFREQASTNAERVAVKHNHQTLTYAQLDHASSVIGRWLMARRLEPESMVCILADRSCNAIVAFLGVPKAHAAYVPLPSNTPPARIEAILAPIRGRPLVLLSDAVKRPVLENMTAEFMYVSDVLATKSPE
jgi:non-ribosomal peptide synthetase component F